ALVKRRLVLVGQEMMAIPLRKAPLSLLVELGRHEAECIGRSQADHESRVAFRGNADADVAARALQRRGDHRRGVHERAVPVEDDEVVVQGFSQNFFRSAGSGASSWIACRVNGCSNESFAAWRNIRLRPFLRSILFSSKSPYLSSPRTGCFRCARCTRIW